MSSDIIAFSKKLETIFTDYLLDFDHVKSKKTADNVYYHIKLQINYKNKKSSYNKFPFSQIDDVYKKLNEANVIENTCEIYGATKVYNYGRELNKYEPIKCNKSKFSLSFMSNWDKSYVYPSHKEFYHITVTATFRDKAASIPTAAALVVSDQKGEDAVTAEATVNADTHLYLPITNGEGV